MKAWFWRAAFLPYCLLLLFSPPVRAAFVRQCRARGKDPGRVLANYILLYSAVGVLVLFCWQVAAAL
jgi:hypothetical protein